MLGLKEPAPPLQIPVAVAPETVPDITEAGLFLQEVKLRPALTKGEGVKLITKSSLTALQLPLLVEVSVSVTEPADNSVALGVYEELNTELLGLNVPLPPLQIPVVVPPDTEPESTADGLF